MFPKFFMLMPPKTGSTAMWYMLSQHPELSPAKTKEVGFINKIRPRQIHDNPVEVRQKYLTNWHKGSNGLKFEITPGYAVPKNIDRIINLTPNKNKLKMIFVTRNPLDRFISHYIFRRAKKEIILNKRLHERFLSDIDETFLNHWNKQLSVNKARCDSKFFLPNKNNIKRWCSEINNIYLMRGLYINSINLMRDKLNAEQILLLKYEDMKENHQRVLNKIFDFLEVDRTKIENYKTNQSWFWKRYYDAGSELTARHKQFVKDYYLEANIRLFQETNIDYRV
tara:strand:+ start:1392 stop:2234 length:843 start_codon:yes stop_codon:yes gene_type:complete